VLNRYGAFNVSLLADLPLFVDPFLLFNSKKQKYRALHDRMIDYLRFLKQKSELGSLDPHLLDGAFNFLRMSSKTREATVFSISKGKRLSRKRIFISFTG
jgi:hypothetical protein